MNAGSVLTQLVCAQRGIVLPHRIRVRVATAAKRWNLAARDSPSKARGLAHRVHISSGRIAAMASGAGEPLL